MINYINNNEFNYYENKKAFDEELQDANYDFKIEAIENNYMEWARNKEGVYNFLKQHPNWREDLMAIDLTIDVKRPVGDIDLFLIDFSSKIKTAHQWEIKRHGAKVIFQKLIDKILSYNRVFGQKGVCPVITQSLIDVLVQQFNYWRSCITYDYQKIINTLPTLQGKKDGEIIQYIDDNFSIDYDVLAYWYFGEYRKPHKNTPLSRYIIKVFNDLDLKDGIFNMFDCKDDEPFMNGSKFYRQDGTWIIDYYFTQTQMTTMLADMCKEKVFKKRFIISINPMDYLTQSHGKIDGSSCHSLKSHGCYHGGIISMMNDPSSVIVYEVPLDLTFNCQNQREFFNSKIQRQLLFIADNIKDGFFQSVYYPSKSNENTLAIADILKGLYKQVYNIDLNTEHGDDIIEDDMVDQSYYLSYDDWFNSKVMTLSYSNEDIHFTIGSKWYNASNRIAPMRCETSDTSNLDVSALENPVYCVDVDETREADDCYYAVDTEEWYAENDRLYFATDTEEWYRKESNVTYAEDTGEYYRDEDNLYYAEDTGCFYCSDDDLYYAEDTEQYYADEDSVVWSDEDDCYYTKQED